MVRNSVESRPKASVREPECSDVARRNTFCQLHVSPSQAGKQAIKLRKQWHLLPSLSFGTRRSMTWEHFRRICIYQPHLSVPTWVKTRNVRISILIAIQTARIKTHSHNLKRRPEFPSPNHPRKITSFASPSRIRPLKTRKRCRNYFTTRRPRAGQESDSQGTADQRRLRSGSHARFSLAQTRSCLSLFFPFPPHAPFWEKSTTPLATMAPKQRIRIANEKAAKNITMRGNVPKTTVCSGSPRQLFPGIPPFFPPHRLVSFQRVWRKPHERGVTRKSLRCWSRGQILKEIWGVCLVQCGVCFRLPCRPTIWLNAPEEWEAGTACCMHFWVCYVACVSAARCILREYLANTVYIAVIIPGGVCMQIYPIIQWRRVVICYIMDCEYSPDFLAVFLYCYLG